MQKYAEKGITTVHYESGETFSIESVPRRDIVAGVNKLNADIIIEQCKALVTNLVYVDQHLGARTRNEYMKHNYEAHADWQGKVYMIEGSNERFPNLRS